MIKIKSKIVMLLTISLIFSGMLFNPSKISASVGSEPSDWAFEEGSRPLNDEIARLHPELADANGYITKTAAKTKTGELVIRNNNVTGSIKGIENFINIDNLEISESTLSGEIPANIGDMVKLKRLSLNNTELIGKIPDSIGKLTNLEFLYLSDNKLSGKIPSAIGKLTKLYVLYLQNNELSGEIPPSIRDMSSLRILFSENNKLSGEIPTSIEDMSSLSDINLSQNELSGEIPMSIGDMSSLYYLNLSNNKLSGEIPTSIGDLTNIYGIDLSQNELSGEIPESIGKLTNLNNLFLFNNKLSGELPDSIGNMSNLKYLMLSNNKLSGEIPSSIIDLTYLDLFALNGNHFTSISQTIYDYIISRANGHRVDNQKHTVDYTTPKLANIDYEFDSLPAYEQFANYGVTFLYTLYAPDGTDKIIDPVVSNGKVTIPANEITQKGDYSLVAVGTGLVWWFTDFEYTTNFTLDEEEISVDTVIVNGEKNKENSTKINIDLSKVPEAGELLKEDIILTQKTRATTSINKETLVSLGNGKYELTINGTWDQDTAVDITLAKKGVVFTPDTNTILLHTKLDSNSGNNGSNNNSGSTKIESTNKAASIHAGDHNAGSKSALIVVGLILSGGYLAIRRKRE